MPEVRTVRVDRRLLSLLTKEPQLLKYLENLGLDVQVNLPDSIDVNADAIADAQITADAAQSNAATALQAVRELADTVALLGNPSPVDVQSALMALQSLEGTLLDLRTAMASNAQLQAAQRRLDELEGTIESLMRPIIPALEGFTAPTLTNSWVNFGAPYNPAGYWKDPFGFVHLRGTIKSGTMSAAAFTLPVGYQPPNRERFSNVSNALFGAFEVRPDGTVVPFAGSNVDFCIDGATFRAA